MPTTKNLGAAERARYQLVIISDVLHHVPIPNGEIFSSALALMTGDGTLILKEWVHKRTPVFLLGYLSDRFVTGDRIRYPSETELRSLARNSFGRDAIRSEFHIRPWRCNLALVISPKGTQRANRGGGD